MLRGHATFELDGEGLDAPAGTLVYARPGQAHGLRRGGRDDDPGDRRHSGRGVPAVRLGGLGASEPAVRERRLRGCHRGGPQADRGPSAVPRAALQPRLLREPRRSHGRCGRAPAAGDRRDATVPRARPRRLGLRPDPRRSPPSRSWSPSPRTTAGRRAPRSPPRGVVVNLRYQQQPPCPAPAICWADRWQGVIDLCSEPSDSASVAHGRPGLTAHDRGDPVQEQDGRAERPRGAGRDRSDLRRLGVDSCPCSSWRPAAPRKPTRYCPARTGAGVQVWIDTQIGGVVADEPPVRNSDWLSPGEVT